MDASLTLVRCPGNRGEWTWLFTELVNAIENRQTEEAHRLVDEGAGFDGDGNVLRAMPGRRWSSPGDRTAEEHEPGNTMLHLAIRQGLTRLALYLISKNV